MPVGTPTYLALLPQVQPSYSAAIAPTRATRHGGIDLEPEATRGGPNVVLACVGCQGRFVGMLGEDGRGTACSRSRMGEMLGALTAPHWPTAGEPPSVRLVGERLQAADQ